MHNKPNKLQYNRPDKTAETNASLVFVKTPSRDGADVMSSGREFQSLGPATANDRSPMVTSPDRGMTSSEEVDDRRRRPDVYISKHTTGICQNKKCTH